MEIPAKEQCESVPTEDSLHRMRPPKKFSRVINDVELARAMHTNSLLFTLLGLGGCIAVAVIALTIKPVSTDNVIVFLIFYFTVGMGLTLGYHRHFTHCGFKANSGLRATLAILGCMAGQGPVIFWVALHRRHHELSDKEGDPHSPNLTGGGLRNRLRGIYHAYIGWTVKHEIPNPNYYARDLLQDPIISTVNKYYFHWIVLGMVLPALLGFLLTGTAWGAFEGFLWGGLVRMFALHNMIWWITSFAHVFGHRDFRSRDLSTNNFWLALPTLGESWHNNHHAFPQAGVLNFYWWQIDISGVVLWILKQCGLVWDIHKPEKSQLSSRRVKSLKAGNA